MKGVKPAITLGILAMLLTIGIAIQLKTIKEADLDGTLQISDTSLKRSLLQWKANCEESEKKLEQSDEELTQLRETVSKLKNDEVLQNKIEQYEMMLGMTDVSGEGITITLADNTSSNYSNNSFSNINFSNYLVHDGNLVSIVNELKSAGAEAISINGKRITNSTAITCAGNVIQINGEKVGSPFVIKAIGSKDLLYGEISKNNGTVYKLKKYGVKTEIKKEENIEISKNL